MANTPNQDSNNNLENNSTSSNSLKPESGYLKFVHYITKHAVFATVIMILALGTLGVSAAQLLAPEDYKPFKANKNSSSSSSTLVSSNISVSSQNSKISSSESNSSVTSSSSSSQLSWTGQITVAPKNTSLFDRSIFTSDICGYENSDQTFPQNGVVSFFPKSPDANDGYMAITNEGLQQTQLQKENYNLAKSIILNKTDFPKFPNGGVAADYGQTELKAFTNSCSGIYSNYLYDLQGITYPNVDNFRVVLSNDGNGVGGSAVVKIFAKKDNNLFVISKSVYSYQGIGTVIDPLLNSCAKDKDLNGFDANCFINKLKTSQQIKTDAQKAAQELVSTFAL